MARRRLLPILAAALCGLAASCARPGTPAGGPQDRRPPVLVAVEPDTFARVEVGEGRIRIVFDETLSERVSGGTMDDVVEVSPATGAVKVKHSGNQLEVELEGGFVPGVVYRVTVLPRLTDRFSNALLDPFEWVFTTGPEFEATALAGEVWDRLTGEPVENVRVVAYSADSVPYVATTDSLGVFAMRYVPSGDYSLTAFNDRNRSRTPDPFEEQGEGGRIELSATDTLLTSFFVMVPDTTPPMLVRGEKVDSVTLRIEFDDHLQPGQGYGSFVRGMYRDSGDTPGVLRVLEEWEWKELQDSLAAQQAREAEAEAEAEAAAAAAADTLAADTLVAGAAAAAGAPARTAAPADRGAGAAGAASQDARSSGPREFLPNGERVPTRTLILQLRRPIEGGFTYTLLFQGVRNVSGLLTSEGEGTIRLPADPEPPTADTTAADTVAVDSLATPPDTMVAPPDTMAMPRDSVATPDTMSVPPDTTVMPPDTMRVPRDSTAMPRDTTAMPRDTTAMPPDTTRRPRIPARTRRDTTVAAGLGGG